LATAATDVQARFEYYLVAHLCYNARILSWEVVCPELSCAMERMCEAFRVCVIWAVLLGRGAESGGTLCHAETC
jgi:hypothetical protein